MRGIESASKRLYRFEAAATGEWSITSVRAVVGEPLAAAAKLSVYDGDAAPRDGAAWVLRGVTSNERYVTRTEKERLMAKQKGLGRREAACAALIPIRKSEAWWQLPQDERHRIFEARSRHVALGLEYLPAVARRLHHCRDLGTAEPFDFLTWFEFAPAHEQAFEELVERLRETEEWRYVEREVDIRLRRE